MKNYEILNLYLTLNKLAQKEIAGKLKFTIYKLLKKVEDEAKPIQQSLADVKPNSSEWLEIEQIEQDIEFEKTLTFEDLEPLEISASDIKWLEPIIKFEEA